MRAVYKKRAFIHPWSISNLRHFILWFASLYPAICVKSPRYLRHFTRSLMLFRTLNPYLWPPLRPQMMTLETIGDVMKPFERREHRFFTTHFFAKTQKRVTMILSNSFIKNSPLLPEFGISVLYYFFPQLSQAPLASVKRWVVKGERWECESETWISLFHQFIKKITKHYISSRDKEPMCKVMLRHKDGASLIPHPL